MGKAKEEHHDFEGVYSIVPGKSENGYPYWLHDNGKNSIWHEKSLAAWIVGYIEGLGSDNGGLVSPFGEIDWPSDVFSGWRYVDNGELVIAQPGEVLFEDPSQKVTKSFNGR